MWKGWWLGGAGCMLAVVACGDSGDGPPPDAAGAAGVAQDDGATAGVSGSGVSGAGPIAGNGAVVGGSSGEGGMGGLPTGGADEPPDSDADFDLTGTWAAKAVVTSAAGGVPGLKSTQYYLTELVQAGTTVEYATRICAYELPSVDLASVTVPGPFQDVISAKVVTGSGEYLSSAAAGATYKPATQIVVVGADLMDIAGDPLPNELSPGTSVDEDGDGNPGVTVIAESLVCSGDIYIALRTIATISGTVESSNLISGTTDADIEQSFLGYSNPCLGLSAVIAIEVEPASPFEQVRIDGANGAVNLDADGSGDITCAELLGNTDDLFSISAE